MDSTGLSEHIRSVRGTIGVAIHRFTGVACGVDDKLFTGFQAECNALKFEMLCRLFNRSRDFRAFMTPFSLQVDAMVVCGVQHPDLTGDLAMLNRDMLPVVTCYNAPVHREVPNVGSDQVGVGRLATEHLIAGGCRRIVLLPAQGVEARAVGYRQALREAGLTIDADLLVNSDNQPDELESDQFAERAIEGLLSAGVAFDGIFAQSDILAMGALRALDNAGVDVPGKVQVIGADNHPICFLSRCRLSSVTVPSRYRTAFAIRMLADRLAGRRVESISCGPKIFKRQTSLAQVPAPLAGISYEGGIPERYR